jgi:hypothetical protein
MRVREIGLGAHLVRETLPKAGARVVEALAVMAKCDPFFEKAGMLRVDYGRDETAIDNRIRGFLEERRFDFKLAKSKAYCQSFFTTLNEENKQILLSRLSEFAQRPFVKVTTVTPDLMSTAFSSDGVYLYWVNYVAVN